jgi:hypothetical protein
MVDDDYKFNFREPETFSYDNVNIGIELETTTLNPLDDEVIVVQYPTVCVSRNEIMHIADSLRISLKQRFPNNDVIFIPNDINVCSFNSREVIDHLRSLADKLEKEHRENTD